MRLLRRWPLLLIAGLFLAFCLWAGWRIHQSNQPIENAYVKIQVGMLEAEVLTLLQPLINDGKLECIGLGQLGSKGCENELWFSCSEYSITVSYDAWYPDPPRRVTSKAIRRPDWLAQLRYTINI